MGQARRRAAGEERVRGVLAARRRRQPKRVRHELGAVVERQARVSGDAAREVSAIVRRNTMDPRGVLSSGIERFATLRVSLMSIAKLTAFIRLANMSSRSMMVGFRLKALLAFPESDNRSLNEQCVCW